MRINGITVDYYKMIYVLSLQFMISVTLVTKIMSLVYKEMLSENLNLYKVI